eukprot:39117-Prymnesium_polylepis.1
MASWLRQCIRARPDLPGLGIQRRFPIARRREPPRARPRCARRAAGGGRGRQRARAREDGHGSYTR